MPTFNLDINSNESEEIFNTSLSDISNKEEEPESPEDLSDIINFIYYQEKIERKENLTELSNTDYEIKQKNVTKNTIEKIETITAKTIKETKNK